MKKKLLVTLALSLFVLLPTAVASAAEVSYISDVTLARGDAGAPERFEKSGYTLLYPLFTGETYVGYKTSSSVASAVTDIVAKGGKLVGESGSDRGPVVGLYYLSDKDSMPLPNNGGLPVRDESGNPVVFDSGDSAGYLIYMPKDCFKPYIADVKVAKAGTKKAAVEGLLDQGCEYFVNENYSTDGGEFVMVGYRRTDEAGEAVTDIVGLREDDAAPAGYEPVSEEPVENHILYITKDEALGNPIRDIEDFEEVEDTQISSKVLTDMRLSRSDTMSKQYVMSGDEYTKACESETTYLMVGMDTSDGKDTGLALITEEEGFESKREAKRELLELGVGAEDEDEAVSGAAAELEEEQTQVADGEQKEDSTEEKTGETDEESTKEGSNFDTPSENTEEETVSENGDATDGADTEAEGEESMQGTVLNVLGGTGATIFFIVLMGIAVVIPVGTLLIKRGMEKKLPKEENEKDKR